MGGHGMTQDEPDVAMLNSSRAARCEMGSHAMMLCSIPMLASALLRADKHSKMHAMIISTAGLDFRLIQIAAET